MLLIHRRAIIEPIEIRNSLQIGFCLDQLFSSTMKKPDMRIDPLDDLAVQLQLQPQHAVRGRVLRPHVDDHGLIVGGVDRDVAELGRLGLAHAQHRTDFAQQLSRRDLAARLEAFTGGSAVYRARALSTLGGVMRIGMFIGPFLSAAAVHAFGLSAAFGVGIAGVSYANTSIVPIQVLDASGVIPLDEDRQ